MSIVRKRRSDLSRIMYYVRPIVEDSGARRDNYECKFNDDFRRQCSLCSVAKEHRPPLSCMV